MDVRECGGIIVDLKDLPKVKSLTEEDTKLISRINEVFHEFDMDGRVRRIEFECGTPPPKPDIDIHCFKICFFGPDDLPYCIWICK